MVQTHDPQLVNPDQPGQQTDRRPWPVIATVALVGAVAFGLGMLFGTAVADDEPESVEAPAIVDQWGEAFVAGDADALAGLYSDGASFNCRAFDFTIGDEEIADVVMSDETDFTEFEPTTVLVGDEIVAVEYMVSATSPSGEAVSTPLLAVFDVGGDGRIVRSTIDYDRAEMFPDQFSEASEEGLSAFGCGAGA